MQCFFFQHFLCSWFTQPFTCKKSSHFCSFFPSFSRISSEDQRKLISPPRTGGRLVSRGQTQFPDFTNLVFLIPQEAQWQNHIFLPFFAVITHLVSRIQFVFSPLRNMISFLIEIFFYEFFILLRIRQLKGLRIS